MISTSFMGERSAILYLMLWGTALSFLLRLRRRAHFRRIAAVWLLLALLAGLTEWRQPAFHWSKLLFIMLNVLLFFCSCAQLTLPQGLFGMAWACVLHQLTCEVWWLLAYCLDPFVPLTPGAPADLLLGAACTLTTSVLNYCTLAVWLTTDGIYRVGPRQLSLAVLMVSVFETLFFLLLSGSGLDDPVVLLGVIPAQFYCAFMLYFQHTLFQKSALRNEVELMNQLYLKQKAQYELSREAVDIINHRCHEMKRQVAVLRRSISTQQQADQLDALERSIRIYDASVQTGNAVLDVLLAEKCLLGQNNHISIRCMADGSCLQFMDPVDLYALMGDALDAAMQEVRALQPPERRIIDLLVCVQMDLAVVRLSHPVEGGAGAWTVPLAGIRRTAQKYGGHVKWDHSAGSCVLKIVFPREGA